MKHWGSDNRENPGRGFFAKVAKITTGAKLLLQRRKLGSLLVQQGKLSPSGLRSALVLQRADNVPLGRILLQQQLITRRRLYSTLAQQWSLRCLAGALTFMISFSSMGAKDARAASIADVPGEISLVSTANSAFAPLHNYPAMFGTNERESANITPFTKWSGMFTRFDQQIREPKYRGVVQNWEASLRPLVGLPLEQMAARVNDMMNDHPYIEDSTNWGVSDYWETPLEFLTRNGDCEDFAIAKYASLRMLGVPEDHMRLAIVKDLQKGVAHALLILYTNNGNAMVLDNQNKAIRDVAEVTRYQPIFSINREGWWLHKGPATTLMASAQ